MKKNQLIIFAASMFVAFLALSGIASVRSAKDSANSAEDKAAEVEGQVEDLSSKVDDLESELEQIKWRN